MSGLGLGHASARERGAAAPRLAASNHTVQHLLRAGTIQTNSIVNTSNSKYEGQAAGGQRAAGVNGEYGVPDVNARVLGGHGRQLQRWQSGAQQEAPAVVQRRPPVTIEGEPEATATPSGEESNSPNMVHLSLGRFSMSAILRAQAPQVSDFDGWEVGVIQMMSGPIATSCYRRPASAGQRSSRIFVDREETRSGPFYPDRDPGSAVFFSDTAVADLGQLNGGRLNFQFTLRAADHLISNIFGFASAVTRDENDRDVELFRHRRAGNFYTYVVARERSSGPLFPLYTITWWMGADYTFFTPGAGIDFVSRAESPLFFRLIHKHLFVSSDFFPVTTGTPMNDWSREHQRQYWGAECPGFIQ